MATTAAQQTTGRGRGRGRATPAHARSHRSQPRYAGLGGGRGDRRDHGRDDEIPVLERTLHKFCHGLYGTLRHETVYPIAAHPVSRREETIAGDDQWLVVVLHEDHLPRQHDATDGWRHMREKLEAVSVLSVAACTASYAWRRNLAFWRQFTPAQELSATVKRERCGAHRPPEEASAVPAPRDDTTMPRFLLDCSFAEITADVVTLLRHVLLGSEKSMRLSFKRAMEALATIPTRTPRPRTIPIALRFARCQFGGSDIVRRIVELVAAVNRARSQRQRELGRATSSAFYYEIVELDFSSVRLSRSDWSHLRRLQTVQQRVRIRLVLDNTINGSSEAVVAFGSAVSSWFDPELLKVPVEEPEEESSVCSPSVLVTGASAVSLDSSALSVRHIVSLFSAVRDTRASGLRELSLRGAFQCCDLRAAWAWVAYGLWCDDSGGELECVDLSRNTLRLEDCAVIRQVIKARDQTARVQLLCHQTHLAAPRIDADTPTNKTHRRKSGRNQQVRTQPQATQVQETPISWRRLRAGATLTHCSAEKSAKLSLTSSVVVRAVELRPNGDAVVLVPGYGFLTVDSSSGLPVENVVEPTFRTGRLHELKLNSMVVPEGVEHPDSVFAALFSSLSLASLTTLELSGNPLGHNTLTAVLAACPLLHALSLEDCELQSIRAIVESYASGGCRIQSLNLTENDIGDRDIVDLCRLITTNTSPASRLRELHLHQNPLSHRGLRALSVAIRTSPYALLLLVLDKAQDSDAHFRPVFYPYHDQLVGEDPLSDDHKREFHHAVVRRLRTTALEPSIIERIYAYAARPLHRRVVWMG